MNVRRVEIASVAILLRDGTAAVFDNPPIQVDVVDGWVQIRHDDLRITSFPADFIARVVTVKREVEGKQP